MPSKKISLIPLIDYEHGSKLCRISECDDSYISTSSGHSFGTWQRMVFFQRFSGEESRNILLKLNTSIWITPELFNFFLDGLMKPEQFTLNRDMLDGFFAARAKGKHLIEYENSPTTKKEYYTYTSDISGRNTTLNQEIINFLAFAKGKRIDLVKDTHPIGFSYNPIKKDVFNLELKFVDAKAGLKTFHTGLHKERAVTLNVHVKVGRGRCIDTLFDFNKQLCRTVNKFSRSFCAGSHYTALRIAPHIEDFKRAFFSRENDLFTNTYSFLRITTSKHAPMPRVMPSMSKALKFAASPVFTPLPSVEMSKESFDSQSPALK